eukprot:4862715-Prymnesium_polylepis.1
MPSQNLPSTAAPMATVTIAGDLPGGMPTTCLMAEGDGGIAFAGGCSTDFAGGYDTAFAGGCATAVASGAGPGTWNAGCGSSCCGTFGTSSEEDGAAASD